MSYNFYVEIKYFFLKVPGMLLKVFGDQQRINLKLVRCDNAGENKTMEEACAKLGLGTKFEYTAVGTSQ